jgi:uncharacterized protein YhaN
VTDLQEKERRLQQRNEERILAVERRKEEELRYEREKWKKEKEGLQQQIEELIKKGIEVEKVEEELQGLREEVGYTKSTHHQEIWSRRKE